MRFLPITIMNAVDMSTAGAQYSNGVDLDFMALGAIQAVFTGSPVGTLKLQISTDNVPAPTLGSANMASNVVNWSDYTGSSVAVTTSGNFVWNLSFIGYRWIRLAYTKTSGTGSLTVTASGKG